VKISFLIHNVFGVGGTNRAVINLASELARDHDVELVSVFRRLDQPMLAIPDAVRVKALVDTRPGSPDRDHSDQRQRSAIVPGEEEFYSAYSRLTDARLREYLTGSGRDVYVGTRPALNLAVATWGPDGAVLVAQEHQTHATLPPALRAAMQASYGRLAAAVTVTEADAAAFRSLTPVPGLQVCAVPNSSPAPALPLGDTSGKVILAAGRLDPVKQYDVLLHAFRSVVDAHPDWSLRIYGAGPQSGALRGLVSDLALNDRMESEWVKGAMLVSSSERESFGMSIIEAMRAGLPVVSTRAPVGPEEIITDGEDGILVPVGDVEALAKGMSELIEDPESRRRMGRCAALNSARFDPAQVAQRYGDLFRELAPERGRPRFLTPRPWERVPARFIGGLKRAARALGAQVGRSGEKELTAAVVRVTLEPSNALRFEGTPERTSWRRVLIVSRDGHDEVAVDLTPVVPAAEAGPGAAWETAATVSGRLAGDAELPEGRWNVHVELADGRRVRATAGLWDTRHVVGLPFEAGKTGFARRLPYQTADQFLAIRSWLRPHHAEVNVVEQSGGLLTLRGRFTSQEGGIAGELIRLVAVSRMNAGPELVSEPTAPPSPGRFDIALDLDRLAERRVTRHDDWDLYLEDVITGGRARVARLSDDIAERKSVVVYDFTRCEVSTDLSLHEESPTPDVQVRPYITVDSDLSLYVRER
jgi:glycosyltransferase involved in cell wall biosynthesis